MPNDPVSIYDFDAQDALFRSLKLDPGRLALLHRAFFKHLKSGNASLDALPCEIREKVAGQLRFDYLEVIGEQRSEIDDVVKTAFRTDRGETVESVRMRIQSGRTSLCVSTQTGCLVGCRFCTTGTIRPARNLSRDEIVAQLMHADLSLREQKQRVRNVVFMGMGEPLFNELAVHATIKTMLDGRGFHLSPKHVTVSTIGLPDAMERLHAAFPDVRLALSLHAARDEVRDYLIPFKKKCNVATLQATVEKLATPDRPVFVEYVLLKGVNDTDADLQALIDWCSDLSVHINLMRYNSPKSLEKATTRPGDGSLNKVEPPCAETLEPSSPERIEAFAAALKNAGIATTVRYSRGNDIAAACGQLAGKQKREDES